MDVNHVESTAANLITESCAKALGRERDAGFHTFRHTCAAILFERGLNVKQVQRWLGHHSPSFTLDTYVHLLDEHLPEPVDLGRELDHGAPARASSAA